MDNNTSNLNTESKIENNDSFEEEKGFGQNSKRNGTKGGSIHSGIFSLFM